MRDLFSQLEEHQVPPPDLFARLHQIPSEHPQGAWRSWWWLSLAPAVGLALLVVWVQWPAQRSTHGEGKASLLQPKGSIWRAIYAHSHERPIQTRELRERTILHPGDLLQFTYELEQGRYVFIVGTTQAGKVYPVHPVDAKRAVYLEKGRGSIPQIGARHGSFRLDGYIGRERFFVLSSARPFSLGDVKAAFLRGWQAAGRDLSKLDVLPGPWRSQGFLIEKRTPKP